MEHTQPKPRPLAIWNPETDRWELEQETIFGHSDAYSETWPTSGMTANGVAYELPTWEHHTAGSGSSSSQPDELLQTPLASEGTKPSNVMGVERRLSTGQVFLTNQIVSLCGLDPTEKLLPTPVAQPSGNTPENHLRKKPGRKVVTDLSILVENNLLETGGKLMPTPTTSEATGAGNGPNKTGGENLRTAVTLLPTPNTMDMLPAREGEAMERQLRRGQGENASRRTTMGKLREDILQTVNPDVFKPTGESTPRLFVDGKPCEEPPLPLQN